MKANRILLLLFLFIASCTEIPENPTDGSLRLELISSFRYLEYRIATEATFQVRGGFIPVGSELLKGPLANNKVIDNLLPGTYVIEYFVGENTTPTFKVFQIIPGKETVIEL